MRNPLLCLFPPFAFALLVTGCDFFGDQPRGSEAGALSAGERHGHGHGHGGHGGCMGGESDAVASDSAVAPDDAAADTAVAPEDVAADVVVPECTASADCAIGSQCTGGSCVACDGACLCTRDEQCPADQICDHGAGTCGALVPCSDVHVEADCLARAECQPIYGGIDCTDAEGGECTSADPNCTCVTFSFVLCADRP
ncbi:MAG: hypothetical protein U1F43_37340 [Myxococcota bacterium]